MAAIGSLGDQLRGKMPEFAADGHNKGITKLVELGNAPDSFDTAVWCLLETDAEFILGDCCVFARRNDGEIGPTSSLGIDGMNYIFQSRRRRRLSH